MLTSDIAAALRDAIANYVDASVENALAARRGLDACENPVNIAVMR